MKRFFLRDIPAEFSLGHAMWNRAQGVPAEERVRHRLREVGRVAQRVFRFLALILILLWFGAIAVSTSETTQQWIMFFAGLIVSGWLVVRVGRGLLLPRDALVLAHSPISNRRALLYEFLALPFQLLLMALGAWLFFRQSYPPSIVGFAVLSWMLLPLLAIGWQCQRRGRAGPLLFWAAIFGAVCFVFFGWLEQVMPRLTPFDEIVTQVNWLPSNWFFNGIPGSLLAGACLSFSVLAIRKRIQQFRLRATPGAQVRFVASENERKPSEVVAVAPPKRRVQSGPHFVTRISQLFWNEEERYLGSALRLGYPQAKFWQWTAFMLFLVAFYWLPSFVVFEDPQVGNWFSVFGPLVVTLMLAFVWKSVILATAFSKFALPGGRFVALAASVPVSERTLFRMYLKEGLVGLLVVVPLQLLLLWMMARRIGLEVLGIDWILILLTLCSISAINKVGAWTRALWESIAFFQPGFRGDLKTGFFRFLFLIPLPVLSFVFILNMGKWAAVRDFP